MIRTRKHEIFVGALMLILALGSSVVLLPIAKQQLPTLATITWPSWPSWFSWNVPEMPIPTILEPNIDTIPEVEHTQIPEPDNTQTLWYLYMMDCCDTYGEYCKIDNGCYARLVDWAVANSIIMLKNQCSQTLRMTMTEITTDYYCKYNDIEQLVR